MKADKDAHVSKSDVYLGRNLSTYAQLGESIIVNLTSGFAGKNHQIYLDTYISSAPLMEYLKIKNVFACAAIRSNKKYLPHILIRNKSANCWHFGYKIPS